MKLKKLKIKVKQILPLPPRLVRFRADDLLADAYHG
jgi:hypothetical protein